LVSPDLSGDLGFIEDPASMRLEGLNSEPVNAYTLGMLQKWK